MAKLNVIIPVADVEINGAKYRKVDRSAQEGDVIRITDEDAPSYVIDGAFYAVDEVDSCGDAQITDEDGDGCDTCNLSFEVYEKVTELAPQQYREVKRKATVGERIRIVDKDRSEDGYENGAEFTVTDAYYGGDLYVNDTQFVLYREYVVLEPVAAETATQPAQPERLRVGEYAKVIVDRTTSDKDPISSGARVGDIVEIMEVDGGAVPFRVRTVVGHKPGDSNWARPFALVRATDEEVAVAKAQLFNVGDTVKLTLADGESPKYGFGGVENGDIGKVVSTPDSRVIVDFPSYSWWKADPSELTKLTTEEVAEIERKKAEEAAREAERAKWAKIGREVNEFKRGDIVEVMESGSSGYRVGLVDVVTHGDDDVLRLSTGTDRTCPWIVSRRVKLVVPVEQRFDRAS